MGQSEYWYNGNRHRDDDANGNPQPAIIYKSISKYYYKNGILLDNPIKSPISNSTYLANLNHLRK